MMQPPATLIAAQWSGEKLDNKDGMFGTSDPFAVFSRQDIHGIWTEVHKTEVIDDSLNPVRYLLFSVSRRRGSACPRPQ